MKKNMNTRLDTCGVFYEEDEILYSAGAGEHGYCFSEDNGLMDMPCYKETIYEYKEDIKKAMRKITSLRQWKDREQA